MRVAVVGGGVTGLATAFFLVEDHGCEVVVLEADTRLGGKILTAPFAGLPVEAGPDAVLARVPWAVDLLQRLGLGPDVVHPATGRAYVWARGALRPLPDGLVLGVPARLGPLLRSGILSPAGIARAGLDLVLPAGPANADPSIAEAIGRRFGAEVVDRLVDPLLSGINAGRADRLSLRATAPDVAALADGRRSLLLALRARPPAAAPGAPVFASVDGGLQRVVERLAARLGAAGADVRTGAAAVALDRRAGGGWLVRAGGGDDVRADAVVVAVPAFAAAPLLAPLSPDAAAGLAGVDYASVALATLAYDEGDVARPLDGSGFLVPRSHGWLTTAATWVSSKWPALRPPGRVILRASAGRAGDDRPAALGDGALVAALHRELAAVLGLRGDPVEWRVDRWPRSFPQYDVGHLARVDAVEAALRRDAPGVAVTGAAYRGVGIASCVRQAAAAAAALAG